jgi:hypothetical protein
MRNTRLKEFKSENGVSLIETMMAVFIAMFSIFGMGTLIAQVSATTKNQGTETTQATIFAQDKIENLLSLNFIDCNVASASQPPSCNSTGISDAAWTQGLLAGGATSPEQLSCPATGLNLGYVDFLDHNGVPLTGTTCADIPTSSIAYVRQWAITDLPTTGQPMKQITVAVYSLNATSQLGGSLIVVLTSVISN